MTEWLIDVAKWLGIVLLCYGGIWIFFRVASGAILYSWNERIKQNEKEQENDET